MVKVKNTGEPNGNAQGCSKTNLTKIKKGRSRKGKSKTGQKAELQDENASLSENVKTKEVKHDEKAGSSSKIIKTGEVKSHEKTTESKIKTFSDQDVQTDNPDVNLVTGDTAPPAYYERLAETRREALESTLAENQELWEENAQLKEKIQELEKQKDLLLNCADPSKLEELYATLDDVEIALDVN